MDKREEGFLKSTNLSDVRPTESKRKASSPMYVTDDGIWIDTNREHPKKARSPMCITEGGKWIDMSRVHSEKA